MKKASNHRRTSRQGPKYEWLKTWIRNQITSGAYPPGHRLPPQDKLSRILKVKVAEITVRRALTDLAQEGLIVRRQKLGSFVANQNIQPLIPGRNLRIGLLWPDSVAPQHLHNSFSGQITLGVLEGLGIQSSETPSWTIPTGNEATGCTWNVPQRGIKLSCIGQTVNSRERHPSLQAVLDATFDGLICLNIIENDWLSQLLACGVPTVLADYPLDDFRHLTDQVFLDPLPAIRAAIGHFLSTGAKSIHYVGARLAGAAPSPNSNLKEWREKYFGLKRDDPDSLLREFAVRRVLTENGLTPKDVQFHRVSYDAGDLEILAKEMLMMPVESRPDAIICHDLAQAESLIAAFDAAGVVLRSAGVTSQLSEPQGKGLPILADGFQIGRTAAELLVSRILRPKRPTFSVGVAMECSPKMSGN